MCVTKNKVIQLSYLMFLHCNSWLNNKWVELLHEWRVLTFKQGVEEAGLGHFLCAASVPGKYVLEAPSEAEFHREGL